MVYGRRYFPEEAYQKAFSYSQGFVYKTHYLMTKANFPSMAASGDVGAQFLKTAYTIRRFTHNYLLSLHHSLKGPEGGLSLHVMACSLAYVVLLAGISAIPFLDELEKFFGKPFRSEMRKTLRDAGGPVLERMGMAGIPALMGIDISGSLKIGIPLIGSGTPQDTVYGVYGGMARKAMNSMSSVEREVSDVNYYFPSATIIIPGSPLSPKPTPYPKRVKRREPVGRPEVHPPAAVSLPAFRPVYAYRFLRRSAFLWSNPISDLHTL